MYVYLNIYMCVITYIYGGFDSTFADDIISPLKGKMNAMGICIYIYMYINIYMYTYL
jgi:hypothetical protein